MSDSPTPHAPQKQRAPMVHAIFYNNPDNYPPIINSAHLIRQAGFELELSCRQDGQKWKVTYPQGLKLRRIDTRSGSSMREYLGFIGRVLRRRSPRPAVIVGHDMHGFLVGRLMATLHRKPLIYHCHDYANAEDAKSITTRGVRWVRAFEQRFARTSDLVIVPDAERGKVIERELRLSKPPVIVANAPLKKAVVEEKLRATLLELGYDFEKIVFRQGRIAYGHALEATLRSIPMWANPRWGFVIMGLVDEGFCQQLQQLARELGIERQFVILPPVSYDEVPQYTIGADIGHALYQPIHVNNQHIATASNKIMEYLASGLPLLVSDTPQLRALIVDSGCGVAADESSPESIAAAINSVLGNPVRAGEMGASAKRAFADIFCYERQFAPVLEAIHRLVKR